MQVRVRGLGSHARHATPRGGATRATRAQMVMACWPMAVLLSSVAPIGCHPSDVRGMTYETDVTARKPRSENARGLTTVGEAWDYMEQVHHAYH